MPRMDDLQTLAQGSARRRMTTRLGVLGATILGAAAIAAPAQAFPGIGVHGPLDGDGFPTYYQDADGMQLQRCLDPICLPVPGETFYWSGGATVGGADLITAQEATVDGGGNNVFGRLRIRVRNLAPGFYRFTTPFGILETVTDGRTDVGTDVGCGPLIAGTNCTITPTDTFTAPAGSEIGPNFLQWDTAQSLPPAGFVGDNATPHRVVGSTFIPPGETMPANYFRVQRLSGAGGSVVADLGTTDEFVILGQLQNANAARGMLVSSSGDVGGQRLNTTSATKTITLRNGGLANLDLARLTVAGPDAGQFAITGGTCNGGNVMLTFPPAAGSSCTVNLAFHPTGAAGARNARIDVSDRAGVTRTPVLLAGRAIIPVLTLAPLAVSYGSQTVGGTVGPRTIDVDNTGTDTMRVTSATLTGARPGDYTLGLNTCNGADVAPGAKCTVDVFFTPTGEGTRSATLDVLTDVGTKSVGLSGTGVAAPVITAGVPGAAGGTTVTTGGGAAEGGTVAGSGLSRLSLRSLGGALKVKRSKATRLGIRLVAGLQPGTQVVRVKVYRKTRLGRILLSDGFKAAGRGAVLRITQRHLTLRRAFRIVGRYEVEVIPGRSRTDLGSARKLAFRIVR